MRATVKQCGNGAAVRIPASILHKAQLELNEAVDVREEAGRIIIEPVRLQVSRLDELLRRIMPKNTAGDFATGKELC